MVFIIQAPISELSEQRQIETERSDPPRDVLALEPRAFMNRRLPVIYGPQQLDQGSSLKASIMVLQG